MLAVGTFDLAFDHCQLAAVTEAVTEEVAWNR